MPIIFDMSYEDFKKDFLLRLLAYEFIQIYHIFYKEVFYTLLSNYFNTKIQNNFIINSDHIIFIKKNQNNKSIIIKYVLNIFDKFDK